MAVIQGRQLEPDHGNVRLHCCCRGRVRRTVPTFSDPVLLVSSTRPPSINMPLISSTSRLLSDYSSLCWRRSLPSVASTQFCCSPTPSDIGAKVSKSLLVGCGNHVRTCPPHANATSLQASSSSNLVSSTRRPSCIESRGRVRLTHRRLRRRHPTSSPSRPCREPLPPPTSRRRCCRRTWYTSRSGKMPAGSSRRGTSSSST